jgi:hypothetical protein
MMKSLVVAAPWNAFGPPQKRGFQRLARPRKRHYTFARCLDRVTAIRARHGATAPSKR